MAWTTVVGMAMLALTAGCGWVGGSTPATDPTDVAVYEPTGEGRFAARLAGVLERVDGCVVVRGDGIDMATDHEYVPVFPRGVHWNGDILVVGGHEDRLGEHAEFGGGELPGQSASALADVPAACAGRPLWLVSGQ